MELAVFEPGALIAFGLYLVRTSVLILSSPLFDGQTSMGLYKIALIVILSALLFSTTGSPADASVTPLVFAALAVREALIGFALSFVLELVLLAVRVGGEMIGHEMAFNMSSVVDPLTGISKPVITQVYEGLFLIGLLALNGHHFILRALSDSFERAPVGQLKPVEGFVPLLTDMFAEMFRAGITLAAPMLVFLSLVSIVIGLLARTVPQLNLIETGFTLRILVGLGAMYLFAPLLGPAMDRLYEALGNGIESVLETAGG